MGGTRVLIVDDHPFFREGLRRVIAAEEDLEVVGEAGDGEETLAAVREYAPDVVVMDVNLPKLNGLEATQRIKDNFPHVQVVILTAYDDEEQIYHAVRCGASAYHAKDVEPRQLVRTIRLVRSGAYVLRNRVLNREQLAEWLQERYQSIWRGTAPGEVPALAALGPGDGSSAADGRRANQ